VRVEEAGVVREVDVRLPDGVVIRVIHDKTPVPGAWVSLKLPTRRKNDFSLLIGPADDDGLLTVSARRIEDLVQETRDMFPMDYPGLPDWTGVVRVSPLGREGVRRGLAVREVWGKHARINTEEEIASVTRYGELLDGLSGSPLLVSVVHDGHATEAFELEPEPL
jgi:hypothetical protein